MKNNFGTLMLDMKLIKDYEGALKYTQSVFNKLKTSLMPFGVLAMVKAPCLLPSYLPRIIADDLTRKFSVIYTNLCVSTKDYDF